MSNRIHYSHVYNFFPFSLSLSLSLSSFSSGTKSLRGTKLYFHRSARMVSTGPPLLFFFSRPTSVEPLFLNPVSLSSSRYIATFNFVLFVSWTIYPPRYLYPPGNSGPNRSIDRSINSAQPPRFRFLKVSFHSITYSFLFVIGHTQGFTYAEAEAETDNAAIVIAGIGSPQSSSTNRRGSTSRPLHSGSDLEYSWNRARARFPFYEFSFRTSLLSLSLLRSVSSSTSIFDIDRNDSVIPFLRSMLDYNLYYSCSSIRKFLCYSQ